MLCKFSLHKDLAVGVNTSDKGLQKQWSLSWTMLFIKAQAYKAIKYI